MMKAFALLVVASIATGCGASAMNKRLDNLERENMALRRQNALLEKKDVPREDVPPPPPTTAPVTPPAVSGSRAWVRQAHGQYVCIVDYDAHISLASRVRFENKVDDRYGLAKQRNNSWVSFTLNGQPVAIVRSTVMGPAVQYHLGPFESCYVELGGADNYKVVATLYKNNGSYQAPVLVNSNRQMRWDWDMGPDDDELPFVFQRHQF